MRRPIAVGLVAAAMGFGSIALAQQAPPSIEASPATALPGETVTVQGTGFEGGQPFVIFLGEVGGEVLTQGTTTARGAISAQFPAPTGIATHTLVACVNHLPAAGTCRQQSRTELRVVAPSAPPTTAPPTTIPSSTIPLVTVPGSTTTSSLGLSIVTTSTPDPPGPSGPTGVAFTTTSTSLALPSGLVVPEAPDPYPDLEITAVEVTQGIQDLQNRMPLVAHRKTLIRVYVAVDSDHPDDLGGLAGSGSQEGVSSLEGVTGLLQLRRGGQTLILYPDVEPIVARRNGGDRTDRLSTLNFTPPPGWTDGETEVTSFVWADHPHLALYADPDPGNNFAEGTVVFQESTVPLVVVVRLNPVLTPAITQSGMVTAVSAATESYQRYHPLDTPNFAVLGQSLGPGPSTSEDDPTDQWDFVARPGDALRRMRWLFLQWGMSESDRIHGLIRTDTPTGDWSGLTHSSRTVAWSKPTELTPGHEAGHQYFLDHAPCKDSNGDGQPDEVKGGPVDQTHTSGLPSCSIAPEDEAGYFGTDLWLLVPPEIYSNDPAHPSVKYPFMGYLSPRFTDAYHYCLLMDTYGISCDPGSIGLPPKTPPGAPVNCGPSQGAGIGLDLCISIEPEDEDLLGPLGPPGSVLLAVPESHAGPWVVVDVDLAELRLGHAQLVDDTPTMQHELAHTVQQVKDGARTNEATIRVTDPDGHVLALIPVSTLSPGSDAELEPPPRVTVEVAPWPVGAHSLALLVDDVVVDSRTVSGPPGVTFGSVAVDGRAVTASWAGDDPDGDRLLYTLSWSVDGGVTWRIVETGLASTELTFDADALALPGGRVTLSVIASDGLTTSVAESQPVEVPAGSPAGYVAVPEEVPQHLASTMSFHAYDPEDGVIESGVWNSSVDGPLGEGRQVSLQRLTSGQHEITVAVVDSDGNESILKSDVRIVPSDIPAPRTLGSEREAETILALGPGGLDRYRPETAATEEPPPAGSDYAWALGALTAALVLVAGAVAWRRSRAST